MSENSTPSASLLGLVAIVACWRCEAVSFAFGEPLPEGDAVVAALVGRDTELRAFAATYRELPRDARDGIVGGYRRRAVAFRAPDCFYRDNAHGHSRLDWRQDPMRKTLSIFHGRGTLLENLNRVVVEDDLSGSTAAPFDVQGELLFDVLWWWPYTKWPSPLSYGLPWSLSTLLRSGEYHAQEEPANIAGRRCIVIGKPGRDVIYVDAAPPHCVLRREIFSEETGALAWRCNLGGHTHHGGNIWIPAWFRSQRFDSFATSKSAQARLVVDTKFEITEVRVNDEVTDEDFQIEPPPGTVRREIIRGEERFQAVTPGQSDHARAMAEWARSLLLHNRTAAPAAQSQISVSGRSLFPLILGLAVGLLIDRAIRGLAQAPIARRWRTGSVASAGAPRA